MRKWFYEKKKPSKEPDNRFRNREPADVQTEAMELYLSDLTNKQTHTKKAKPSGKRLLAYGICFALCIGSLLFFLLGGGKRLQSLLNKEENLRAEYLQLEKANESPITQTVSTISELLTNFMAKNTHWTGYYNASYGDYREYNSGHYSYNYTIDGHLNDKFAMANLDLSLANTKVGTTSLYKEFGTNTSVVSLPEYSSKAVDMNIFSPQLEINYLEDFACIRSLIANHYDNLMSQFIQKASISYYKEGDYTIGHITSPTDYYEFTLSKAKAFELAKEFLSEISSDSELNNMSSELSVKIQYIAAMGSIFLSETKHEQNDSKPYVTLKVYCKDEQLLGACLTLLDENTPITIFLGKIQMDNETFYRFYIHGDTDTDDKKDTEDESDTTAQVNMLDCQLNIVNFSNKYNGDFTISDDNQEYSGTFSDVTFDDNATICPISGRLVSHVTSQDPNDHSSIELQIELLTINNELKIAGTKNNITSIYDEYTDFSSSYSEFVDSQKPVSKQTAFNISVETEAPDAISSPITASTSIANTWEEFASALNNEPIENYVNNYCKAFGSTTSFTHANALALVKNGYLFPFFPDRYRLANLFSGDYSYYVAEDFNLEYGTPINILGDYEVYPPTDGEDIDNYIAENLKDVPLEATKNTFNLTIEEMDELIDIIQQASATRLKKSQKDENYFYILGNIFTSHKCYKRSCSKNWSSEINSNDFSDPLSSDSLTSDYYDPEDSLSQPTNLSIQYDTASNKVLSIYLDYNFSGINVNDLHNFMASIVHFVDSRVAKEDVLPQLMDSYNSGFPNLTLIGDTYNIDIYYSIDSNENLHNRYSGIINIYTKGETNYSTGDLTPIYLDPLYQSK